MSERDAVAGVEALQQRVLDRWCKGDPHGYTDNAADDVTYCDHMTDTLRVGVAELKAHLVGYEGKVDVPRYEIERRNVKLEASLAVASFNWYSYSVDGQITSRWNATEAFRHVDGQWRYVHMHWARVKEGQ